MVRCLCVVVAILLASPALAAPPQPHAPRPAVLLTQGFKVWFGQLDGRACCWTYPTPALPGITLMLRPADAVVTPTLNLGFRPSLMARGGRGAIYFSQDVGGGLLARLGRGRLLAAIGYQGHPLITIGTNYHHGMYASVALLGPIGDRIGLGVEARLDLQIHAPGHHDRPVLGPTVNVVVLLDSGD